jgi:hypothetical protein
MSAAERFAGCYRLMDALDRHLEESAHDPQRTSKPRERAMTATGTGRATRGPLAASAPVGGA